MTKIKATNPLRMAETFGAQAGSTSGRNWL